MSLLAEQPALRSTSARPLRLGFLGLGWIGQQRCASILRDTPAQMIAYCDADPLARQAAARLAPGAVAAGNLSELLRLELDGIVIATPSAMHAEQSVAALEAGCAVFCQKPLGRTAAETRRVVDAARAADRLLAADFSYRFIKGVDELRGQVQAGAAGEIFAADLVFHNAYGPDKPWYYDALQAGGGCVLDLAIHLVDLLLWTFPNARVTRVDATLRSQGAPPRSRAVVDDYAVAQIELSSGLVARLACSWRLPAGCDCDIQAIFYGSQAAYALRNVGGSFYDFRVQRLVRNTALTLTEPPDDWGGRSAVAWAGQLAQAPSFDPQAEHYVRVADVIDRIYDAGHSHAGQEQPYVH